jgi:hypothetical protein
VIVDQTWGAYSRDRYASWKACVVALLNCGYGDQKTKKILRSRIMRSADDQRNNPYGQATSRDLMRYMGHNKEDVWFILREPLSVNDALALLTQKQGLQ